MCVGTEVEREFPFTQEELSRNSLYECTFSATVQADDGQVFPLLQLKVDGGGKPPVYVAGHAVDQGDNCAHNCRFC